MGWSGRRNGELVALATDQFDVFLTVDRNLLFQQHLARAQLAVIILAASSNRLQDLAPLMQKVREALSILGKGQVVLISP
jgi:hypothetical protein